MTKILLVEDDKSLQEIYGVRLGSEGYNVLIAGDGEEALNIALNEKPDLILSDVMMPKISGFDMLDILRSTPGIKDTKVIIMTALSSDDQRERGEKLGANVYLVKSQVGIEDVVQVVKNLLEDKPADNQLSVEEISEAAAQEATNQPLPTEPTEADFEQAKTELRNDIFQTSTAPEQTTESDRPTAEVSAFSPNTASSETTALDSQLSSTDDSTTAIDQLTVSQDTTVASQSASEAEHLSQNQTVPTEPTSASIYPPQNQTISTEPTSEPAYSPQDQATSDSITINPQYRQPASLRDLIPERQQTND